MTYLGSTALSGRSVCELRFARHLDPPPLPFFLSPTSHSSPPRSLRSGSAADTRGTAFVVYEDIYDAKHAVEHLAGFNVCGRYLVVLYYAPKKAEKRRDLAKEKAELDALKKKYGLAADGDDESLE